MSFVPLLILPLAFYNIAVFILNLPWSTAVTSVQLPSGGVWAINVGDCFIALCLFLLFFEVLKSTRRAQRSLIDHLLSTILFIAALVEFLIVPQVANSVFAVLLLVMLVDVLAGFSVSLSTAQRDVTFDKQQGW